MNRYGHLVIKIFLLIFGLMMVGAERTDADLMDSFSLGDQRFAATTLDFSNRDTSNNDPAQIMFNVLGMVYEGFQVRSLRIYKDGALDFSYKISTEKTGGDDSLCNALNMQAYKNWAPVFDGNMLEHAANGGIENRPYDDWVFVVLLKDDSAALKGKTCDFKLVIDTTSDGAFEDQEILINHVGT